MMIKKWHWEVMIGITQIIGQFVGSTTPIGASIYFVCGIAWCIWMCVGKHWGFIPITLCGLGVSIYTLVGLYA